MPEVLYKVKRNVFFCLWVQLADFSNTPFSDTGSGPVLERKPKNVAQLVEVTLQCQL